ncbi:DUF4214 domain-containing protein [Pseudomonas syringae]|uniref:DUF4214 domain-containing protein n=1 Tax=Pseudomonas syringae CC1417 TaxID=1357272 RepID=A0AAU8L8U9_PSESX
MATTTTQIQQLYVAYLGRAADKAGLDYWSTQLNGTPATLTLDDLRANFVNEQPEYAAAYGGLSRVDTVTKIYNNLFGRAPDAAGLTYWTTGGGVNVSADDLLVAFINGAGTADAATITNKVLVSELYTSAAGTNYLAADAKSVITGVTDSSATLTAALAKLTDGSLSGIALGTATVNLKASVSADAAVTSYEANQLAAIKAIGAQLETLTKANAQLPDQTVNAAATTYTAADTDLSGDLTAARAGALAGKTTATLTTEAATAATDLTTAANALRTTDAASVDKITAFDAASKAVIANKAVATDTVTEVTGALQAYGSIAGNATVWNKALADAGGATDAAGIYAFLTATTTTAAQVTAITNDFAGVTSFTAFGTAAAQDKLAVKATADLSTATTALNSTEGNAYIAAYNTDATAKLNVTASTALDALDASYKTIDTAHDALTAAQTAATAKLATADVGAVAAGTVTFTDDANKAQVFYFPTTKKADGSDGVVTLEAGKDSLYIGEGYTLNKTAALGSTGITGADNNSLEVFFVKETGSNFVKAVIETSVAASTTVTTGTLPVAVDNVSVITLTGVTDVSQVTFANGVISHV